MWDKEYEREHDWADWDRWYENVRILRNLFARLVCREKIVKSKKGRESAVGKEVGSTLSVQVCYLDGVLLGRAVSHLHA